ncbi:YcnI family protein [Kribbella catacumbae]|uniref:YcnI family copper-binding membrane protein n=1 Tax=Kribbella catacumbae TaxID=460086 RepID=UPI00037C5529|nr:YcnI family protein [Kribbella catacumbae]
MSKKLVLRAAAITAATALVLVGATSSASAHVTVSSPDAKPGGYAKLVFRVPSESDTASTTKLVVTLPKDHPFAHVGAQVKDGWKVVKTTEKLPQPVKVGDVTLSEAITAVTWTAATAVGVPPNDFDEFALSVGKLPEGVDSLNFPAVQTYSDGEVAKWDEIPEDGGEKPKHPAPTLELKKAITPVAATTTESKGGSDTLARVLGGAGLLLGLVGLGLGLRAGRTRKATP